MAGKGQKVFFQEENRLDLISSKIDRSELNSLLRKGNNLVLGKYRTLSIQEFSYPFSDTLKIREALNLKVMPLASSSGGLEVFPVITSKESKNSRGFAWFVSKSELETLEKKGEFIEGRKIFIPLPVIFAPRIHGIGAGIWADSQDICSVIFDDDGIPLFYGYRSRKKVTPEEYVEWLYEYGRSRGIEIKDCLLIDSTEDADASEKVLDMVVEFLSETAFAGDINLSRTELDTELYMERIVRIGGKAAAILALAGLLLFGTSAYRYYSYNSTMDWLDERSARIYREVFDPAGRIVDPLSQARGKIRELGSTENSINIEDLLGILGRSAMDLKEGGIVLDGLRYNGDTLDINGSTMDMISVQDFQRVLQEWGIQPQIGDIQQIPGGGLRFTMAVEW